MTNLSTPRRIARMPNGGDSIAYGVSTASVQSRKTAATMSVKDKLIKVWDLSAPASPRLVATHPVTWNVFSEDVAFSPHGHTLAAVDETGPELIAVP